MHALNNTARSLVALSLLAASAASLAQTSLDTLNANNPHLAHASRMPGAIQTSSGLVIAPAGGGYRGAGPTPRLEDTVAMYYVGMLADGTVFANAATHKAPPQLKNLIPCLQEGLQLMHAGDTDRITCPPHLAYGDQGLASAHIPPGATLEYRIELDTIMHPTPIAPAPPAPPSAAVKRTAARVSQSTASPHYSGNRQPDATCGEYVPQGPQLLFNCTVKKPLSVPTEVQVSMHNTSGCRVVARGRVSIGGTHGNLYTSAQFGNKTSGFDFLDTHVPFGRVLAPNVQETPSNCSLDNIQVCSATAPASFPAATYFDPFRNPTNCANFSPLSFNLGVPAISRHLAHTQENACISVETKLFYPGQAGSVQYFLTNNCNVEENVIFATFGMSSQLVHLNPGQGRFSGWTGHVPAPYKFWYCSSPEFPSNPDLNPQDGPEYAAITVLCRDPAHP
jgi:FKBP-type peptidyl-prolyl cis-trans isomerase FkpA